MPDHGERMRLKVAVCTLLSDLGIMDKMPGGRTDVLVDGFATAPEFFRQAVLGQHPPKGSRDWRWARDFALEGKVPGRKKREPRAPRVPRPLAEVRDGVVRIRASLRRELVAAGQDLASAFRAEGRDEDEIEGSAPDLAEGMLVAAGVDPGIPGFRDLRDAAADWVLRGAGSGRVTESDLVERL